MSLGTILIIILILVLVGALPSWPHSRNWGYGPSGILGVVVVVILMSLMLAGMDWMIQLAVKWLLGNG